MGFALRDAHVAIVGLGLMGGSLAARLTNAGGASGGRACRRVTGIARRPATIAQALHARVIDDGTCALDEGVREADLVALCTPVRTIARLVAEIGPSLHPGAVLTDVGSAKQSIVEAMDGLPPHVQAIGGHPMCGKEVAGLDAADPRLFEGATYVLVPLARTDDATLGLLRELVAAVGARPLVLDATHHDRVVAAASHLPYLLATALVRTALGLSDDAVWQVAASGFRDTSRLAASDETMMLDILCSNRAAVRDVLARCRAEMEAFDGLLAAGDEEGLRAAIHVAAEQRRRMFR